MPTLSIAVLGPLTITLDGRPVTDLHSVAAQALLVYLATEPQETVHRREALAELLWPGMLAASGRKNLRQALYELRQAIPEVAGRAGSGPVPLFLADRETIQLNPAGDYELDAGAFEKLLVQGDTESLAAAVEHYRGDFLKDFSLPGSSDFEEWAAARRAYYRRRVLDALDRLAREALEEGNYERSEAFARRQLALDDLREPAHRQLMEAMVGAGRRPEALAHYDHLRQLLRDELGVEPSAATVALQEAIVAGRETRPVGADAPERLAREEGVPVSPNNLPPQATAFVGREEELAEIRRALVDEPACRLLTLLGPGGSGKTRLALEAAGQIVASSAAAFPDGIWFVPLDALSDPESVVAETAKALAFPFFAEGHHRRQLLDYLRDKQLLLLMDNYEHLLLEGQPLLAADILASAPRVKVLVTSRSWLNVHGERLMAVAGLAYPPQGDPLLAAAASGYSAIQLFVRSARQVRPGFEVNQDNLPAVIRICRLVQGLPLGVELAAAWLELLSPEEVALEIERGLEFLEADWRNRPERQRSLRAVFETSWKMLGDEEQTIVKALAVFRGAFSREAAQQVSGASLKELLALVNKSWLARGSDDRLQIHVLLRQFGREKLRREETGPHLARAAHADYHAAWLGALNDAMRGPGQKEAFDAVSQAFEDIRAAWDWLVEQEEWAKVSGQMLAPLLYYSNARGGRARDILAMVQTARQVLADKDQEPVADAVLAIAAAALARGYFVIDSIVHWEHVPLPAESVRRGWEGLVKQQPGQVDALWLVLSAFLYGWQVDSQPAVQRLRQLVDNYRLGPDRWALAYSQEQLGRLLSQKRFPSVPAFVAPEERRLLAVSDPEGQARWEEARRLLAEAATLWRELGDRLQLANTVRLLASHTEREFGSRKMDAFREAQRLYEQLGDPFNAARLLHGWIQASLRAGEVDQAFLKYREILAIYERLGNRTFVGITLGMESMDALRYGDLDRARWARERSLAISREQGDEFLTGWSLWELGDLERVAGDLEEARRLYRESLPFFQQFDDEVGRCFYHKGLGDLALAGGSFETAQKHFQQALAHAQTARHVWSAIYCRCGLARAAMALGDYEGAQEHLVEALRAARLNGLIDLTPMVITAFAQWHASTGQPERAIALGAFADNHHMTWQENKEWVRAVIESAAGALPEETVEAALKHGRQLDIPSAVLLALSSETVQ